MAVSSLVFEEQPGLPLKDAMIHLTREFDWDTLQLAGSDTTSTQSDIVRVIDATSCLLPLSNAYGWFHKNLSAAHTASAIDDFFAVTTDEDHVHIAEHYSGHVLGLTDIDDALYFRRGVWLRELRGHIAYAKHRDHAGHTLNNYLLGWYFFVHCPIVTKAFQQEMALRDPDEAKNCNDLYSRFGQVWCFASLLHDVGYVFEGALHNDPLEAIDDVSARGIQHVKQYFTDIFWRDLDLRGADEKQAAKRLADFDDSWSHSTLDSPELVIDFLRMIGPLGTLGRHLLQNDEQFATLPSDGFELWSRHFAHFGQHSMAERLRAAERELYRLADNRFPKPHSDHRYLDHGACGGLLLLKYSTAWFKLILACQDATPPLGSYEAKARSRLESATGHWFGYYATHWWKNILWATGAVALHNVQQRTPDALLHYNDGALAYLGILVDILQEWDRPSSHREHTVEGNEYRISSLDITIGTSKDGRICLTYRCRDRSAAQREQKMRSALDRSLADWSHLVTFSFRDS